jgi:hypothetical protein
MDRYRRGAQRRLGVDIILRILFKCIIETAQTIVDAIGAWPRGILGILYG